MSPLLETRNLSVRFGDFQALFDIDFNVAAGECVAIVGSNGAGKSSFLCAIAGVLPVERDAVILAGETIGGLPACQVVTRGATLVPEGRRLFSSLTVEENLLMGAYGGRAGDWDLQQVYRLFPRLGEYRKRDVPTLSGGEQQMVAIGRALMSNPNLLMCDELSLGLAPKVIGDIYDVLGELRQRGITLVIVEQNVEQALFFADRIYCFRAGRVSLCGRPSELTTDDVAQAYFGVDAMFFDLANSIIQGVLLGGLYGLFAAGLSLVFGVMRLVNVAHGDFIVLAAFLTFALQKLLGLESPFAAAFAVVPLMFILGYVLQRYVLNPTLGSNILRPVLVTFGLSVVLQNGLLEVFSADSRKLQGGWLEVSSFELPGGIHVGLFPLATLGACVAVITALQLFLFHTRLGRAFRATSDDLMAASLMGIDTGRLFSIATGITMATVAVAAVFMGIRATFDPSAGSEQLIFAFEAVIIGGLGSLWGTLAGGMVLSISQSLGASISPSWQILAGHLVFLLILLVRPRGLFPKRLDD